MIDVPSEVVLPRNTVQHRLVARLHPVLAHKVDQLEQFLFSGLLLIFRAKTDVRGTRLSKHFHLEKSGFCVANRWLVASFVEHGLLLDEEGLGHPLDVLGQVGVQSVLHLDQGQSEQQHHIISVNHGPANRPDNQSQRLP